MARQPRFSITGQAQHIIQKGNNKKVIFSSDRDYRYYLDKLGEKCLEHNLDIHAYVLMPNHTHILATPFKKDSITRVFQSLGRCYAQYYNYIHDRTGTLFEGRYKATVVDADTYLLDCYRYIELNPVRSSIVNCPSEYIWSSYRHNTGILHDNLIKPHNKYLNLRNKDQSAADAYRNLFLTPLDIKIVNEITEATNKSWVLGSNNFKKLIESSLNRRSSPKPRGGDRKSRNWNVKYLEES